MVPSRRQERQTELAGQRLGQAADSVFAIYERKAKAANDIRVQDANDQYINGTREILRTGPDAYYKQSGADAINGAAATAERLTKLKDKILGQAANEHQRQRLRPILDAHHAASADGIVRYAGEQQAVYERTVASTAIETSKGDAVAHPANLANAVARAEGATRALFKGQAPEVIENEGRKVGGSIVSAVIGDHLARNDPRGLALFRQHRDRLDPGDRRALGAAAETLSNIVAAADWRRDRSASLAVAPAPTGDAALDAVKGASPATAEPPPVTSWSGRLLDREGVSGHRQRLAEIEDRRRALTALNEREFAGDPARLQANQRAIDSDAAWKRAAVKAEADEIYAGLDGHMRTGGPGGGPAVTLPPPTIMRRLTAEQQEAVAAQVDRAIEGKKTRTDPSTWYAIQQGLTGDDADERERWAHTNLIQFRGELSDEDFAALTRRQTTVRTNDGGAESTRVQAITGMANRVLLAAGVDPTPGPDGNTAKAAAFHRALQDELSAFESKGRTATAADAQDVVDRLAKTALKGGWLEDGNRNDFLIKASHTPAVEDAVFPAQAQPADDKPNEPRSGTAPAIEPDPGSALYRDADRQARDIVADQEIEQIETERDVSEWMTRLRPGAPLPELPEEIARRLGPDQKQGIQDIIAAGADTVTDPDTLKEILLGLTSKDREERLKWAREPLFHYRPLLSPEDFGNLVVIQHNMSPRDGVPIGGAGTPIGTLDEAADLVAALRGGPLGEMAIIPWAAPIARFLAREALRAGRWAWDKIKGKDESPPGKNVPATEEPRPTGAVAAAAKAIRTVLPTNEQTDIDREQKAEAIKPPASEILTRISEQPGKITNLRDTKLSDQEKEAGEAFAAFGHNVWHKKESVKKGVQTADLHVGGIGDVEVYSPLKTTNERSVLRKLEEKKWQAPAILVQAEFPLETMQSIAARFWGRPNVTSVNTLFFQSPAGEIGRFDRPAKPSK